ncbi:MAG: type II secretion system F family protein [Candidatus Aenigmatarchaeota archaeon]|nr:MAG: type II secretion system F family protein [Candidatus Aenigmarchaeota archaeon]
MLEEFKILAVRLFGRWADRYAASFEGIRKPLSESGLKILFRTYVCMVFLSAFLAFAVSLPVSLALSAFAVKDGVLTPVVAVVFSVFAGSLGFIIAYYYPSSRASDRKRNIAANLPFAVNHMAAIAASGVPPNVIFKLLAEFGEYEEISRECAKVVRGVESFGQDITTSISQVAADVPSNEFRELLYGMLSIIKTGGNLKLYLQNQAKEALFYYRIRRQEYLEALSTYADFYTAVLIAAPLFLVSILAVINIIGGKLGGQSIDTIMTLGIFIGIPAINTIFLGFIHATQPEQA